MAGILGCVQKLQRRLGEGLGPFAVVFKHTLVHILDDLLAALTELEHRWEQKILLHRVTGLFKML